MEPILRAPRSAPWVSEVKHGRLLLSWNESSPYVDVALTVAEAGALIQRVEAALYLDAIKEV